MKVLFVSLACVAVAFAYPNQPDREGGVMGSSEEIRGSQHHRNSGSNDITFHEYLSPKDLTIMLYGYVRKGYYQQAGLVVENLKKTENYVEAIRSEIRYLLKECGQQCGNVMQFAYYLWSHRHHQEVVRECFPRALGLILSGAPTKITNVKYNTPLKLDVNADQYGDRLTWGSNNYDNNDNRFKWQFQVIGENATEVYITNMGFNQILKLDVNADQYGDRLTWGSNEKPTSMKERFQWILYPLVGHDGSTYFVIINKYYQMALKQDSNTDSYGDRKTWGSKDYQIGSDRYNFYIMDVDA